jgi:hypothetical protein
MFQQGKSYGIPYVKAYPSYVSARHTLAMFQQGIPYVSGCRDSGDKADDRTIWNVMV